MNRSFTARLSANTSRRLRDYLWGTHRIFNESLAYLLKHYFWMQNLTDRTPEQDQKNRLRHRFDEAQIDRLRLIYRDMMGLDLPKDKRAGRSQSAQAWMEPITFSSGSKGEGPGESSKNIQANVKVAIRETRRANLWLFDRELALPLSPDHGFRRGLFGAAARRILNFEQNQDTHRGYYDEAKKAYERWTAGEDQRSDGDEAGDTRRAGWRRTLLVRTWEKHQSAERERELDEIAKLTWSDFERARCEFAQYERNRAVQRAQEQSRTIKDDERETINAAVARGWRDIYERLLPPGVEGPPDAATATEIIKAYQTAEPRRVGDINFFLWLADKPHLWRFVETMKAYNWHQRKLRQYARNIQFRYPRYDRRPDWFTFSETSPGHMYTIVSMHPMVIELSVLVPAEDAPVLKKLARGQPLSDEEREHLDRPIDWNAYHLTPDRLAERRAAYRGRLEETEPGIISRANLEAVHDWTDSVWQQLIDGFFHDDPPLDLSRFKRVMVRYTLASDARLRPFVEEPSDEQALLGRLVVKTDERQKPHWQGKYGYWFGPLATSDGSLADRRCYLHLLPLLVGGIRLEYRGRLRPHGDPIFTLSCELDERIVGSDGKRTWPSPGYRIPKKSANAQEGEQLPPQAARKKRSSARRPKMPVGLRVLAIDLGMRRLATGVVVEFVDDGHGKGTLPHPFKPVAVEFLDAPGIGLVHIQRHQDERRRKQRKACPRGSRRPGEIRGAHLPRGQEFARELLKHTENLKDDRRKKAANAILVAALKHKVDYILFENLKGYRPDFEFGRRINAALMNWNRRELVEFVKMEAAPFGVWVYEYVAPHHTSRFCHRCGAVGYRFSQITERQAAQDALAPQVPLLDETGAQKTGPKGEPLFRRCWQPEARRLRGTPLGLFPHIRQAIDGGKHFCCPDPACGLIVNADYNAAMNLVRKLAADFPAYERYSYNQGDRTWNLGGQRLGAKAFWEHARATVQQRLNERFKQPPDTPPAGGWPKGLAPRALDVPW